MVVENADSCGNMTVWDKWSNLILIHLEYKEKDGCLGYGVGLRGGDGGWWGMGGGRSSSLNDLTP